MKRGKEFGPAGQRYFGPGKSADDTTSYNAALANYRQWKSEQASTIRQNETMQRVVDVLHAINGIKPDHNAVAAFNGQPDTAAIVEALAGTEAEGSAIQGILAARAEQETRRQAIATIIAKPTNHIVAAAAGNPPPSDQKGIATVAALVDAFDQHNESRNKKWHLTRELAAQGKSVTVKKNQVVSDETLGRLRRYGDRFKLHFAGYTWDGKVDTATNIMAKWKKYAESRTDETTGTGLADHDAAIKFIRTLMQWAWINSHLEGMPRNLGELTQKYDVKRPGAESIPLPDLHKLYRAAADDMRAWMLLGLNAGYYGKDVALLTGKMIGPVHLDHWRNKTINTAPVNVKYKLWGITRKMIERSRTETDPNSVVWKTRKGHSLIHFKKESRKRGKTTVIGQQFAKLCKACELVKPDGKPKYNFTNLRDTGTTMVEKIDRAFSDLYDAHKDERMANLYVDGKMMDTTAFDKVIDELEKRLAMPKVEPKKTARKKKTAA
jgi:hypothetical protein